MTQLSPYLTFNGNCREAMIFYQRCLGGDLAMQEVAGSPIEAQCPSIMREKILHATLSKDGLAIMASDMIGPEGYVKGNTMALSVACSSAREITDFFEKLAVGGTIIHHLAQEFWGATLGVLTDKFGVRWMFTYEEMSDE